MVFRPNPWFWANPAIRSARPSGPLDPQDPWIRQILDILKSMDLGQIQDIGQIQDLGSDPGYRPDLGYPQILTICGYLPTDAPNTPNTPNH